MILKMKLKAVLFKFPRCYIDTFYSIYNQFHYPELKEVKKSYGEENADKIFYVIRPRTNSVEGLMSLLNYVLIQISYAEVNGFIPVVDFKNYTTQYRDVKGGCANAWEFYFKQPSNYSLDEVYRSKDVILSGINMKTKAYSFLFEKSFIPEDLKKTHALLKRYISFSDSVLELLQKEELLKKPLKTLGLYLRGTDYVRLKPAGEFVQPTIELALAKADENILQMNLQQVFLVTEDEEIYKKVKEHYGEKLYIATFDTYINNYTGKDFLVNDPCIGQLSNSPYRRGLQYLVKILMLSHCECIIGGKTCGSWVACGLADESVKKDLFELGKY